MLTTRGLAAPAGSNPAISFILLTNRSINYGARQHYYWHSAYHARHARAWLAIALPMLSSMLMHRYAGCRPVTGQSSLKTQPALMVAVAQLVEPGNVNPEVAGSRPVGHPTPRRGGIGRRAGLRGPCPERACGFESHRRDMNNGYWRNWKTQGL